MTPTSPAIAPPLLLLATLICQAELELTPPAAARQPSPPVDARQTTAPADARATGFGRDRLAQDFETSRADTGRSDDVGARMAGRDTDKQVVTAPSVEQALAGLGKGKPMPFSDLSDAARQGFVATASEVLAAVEFVGFARREPDPELVKWLALVIHDGRRSTIERGWVIDPARSMTWQEWDKTDDDGKKAATDLAKYLLERFDIQKLR